MAQRTRIELMDDMDGGPAVETISFSLDAKNYEIDLSAANARRMRSALEPFINAGRKVGQIKKRRSVASTGDAGNIRAWAISQGVPVSARGRVSAEIRQAYEAAHS
ncbi:MAG: Lsr2 family protein [Propionibacteriaceae bacterium]|nr:Lsr2 family protein [Propionibacteriaceae bacterium]